ncbi:MAG TPA: hypothetical protein VFG04_02695 [Planctomycetaceae bacterium]|nr:hypothetical protein [Planctomycetaceae bacterium]
MNESDAVEFATQWVRSHYPTVPPIAGAIHLDRHWVIYFRCSWDTDALGMPETLIVAIDGMTREVLKIS